MKITVIVAKIDDSEMPWILGAWDEYLMDANYQGYLDAIQDHIKKNSGAEIRTAEIEVPEGFLQSIYRPIKVKGRLVGPEGVHGGGPARGQDGTTKGHDGGQS